jgi:hypothetical protein
MTKPDKFRDVAIKRFHGSREALLRMVKANKKGLTNDQLENGQAQVKEMAKLVKTLEAAAPAKTMTQQFDKFMTEWTNATKGKGMGKIEHYLTKMGTTPFGAPPPPAPARPSTPAPSTRPVGR